MRCILIISPEPWGGNFVSKHHYAVELAKRGHDVLFYGPPSEQSEFRLDDVRCEGGRLRILRSSRVAPGLRLMPGFVRRRLENRWLQKVEQLAGQRIEAVWLFENSRFYDMGFAGGRLKIYHQVDMNQDLHPGKATQTADFVIALNSSIAGHIEALAPGKAVHKVPHGLAIAEPITAPPDVSAFTDNKIHAAYIGNLGIVHLDLDAFQRVVAAHRDEVVFHLIGSYSETTPLYQRLEGCENVVWWGRVPSEHIGYYLEHADINMLIYKAKEDTAQMSNSHKILEYLYSGNVTVSSYVADYAQQPGLLEMVDLDGDYPARFASVVRDIDRYNRGELKEARQAYARGHTYTQKLDYIAELVLHETGHKL